MGLRLWQTPVHSVYVLPANAACRTPGVAFACELLIAFQLETRWAVPNRYHPFFAKPGQEGALKLR